MKSPIIDKIEKFIQRIHEFELVISERADRITFKDEKTGNTKGFGAALAESIHDYEIAKKKQQFAKAVECLIWIDRALYYHYVDENSEPLLKKIKEKDVTIQGLREENKKLTEEAEKSATDLVFIQGRYEELNEKFNKMVPKGDFHE